MSTGDDLGDVTQAIRDRLTCIGLEIGEVIRESYERVPALPPDERGRSLDIAALPPWLCCRRRGEHAFWCVWNPSNAPFEDSWAPPEA